MAHLSGASETVLWTTPAQGQAGVLENLAKAEQQAAAFADHALAQGVAGGDPHLKADAELLGPGSMAYGLYLRQRQEKFISNPALVRALGGAATRTMVH